MNTSKENLPYGLKDEIDLLEYIGAVLRSKYWIMLLAVISGSCVYGLTLFMPEQYEAFVKINLVEHDAPGGVTPDNRRAPEVMTLVEHGFIMGKISNNYRHVIMAKMKSRTFTIKFINDNNVLPYLFAKKWDKNLKKWTDGFKPDIEEAFKRFNSNIRFVNHNKESDLMAVRMRFGDSKIVAEWANMYVSDFNKYMRQKAIDEIYNKLDFLNKELERTNIVEMQKSIYRIIEAQTAISMLANARKDYIFEVLDPAVPPLYKSSPKRKRAAVLGFVGGVMFGISLAIGRVLFNKIKKAVDAYR